MAERQKQEQLRATMEQLSNIKKEIRNLPHLEVIEKIGQGSFGDIFKVWDSRRGIWSALKFEKKDKKSKISLIKKEAQIMVTLKGSQYFARLYDSRFSEASQYNFIQMTFLGPNLESLKKRTPTSKLSMRCVLLIANQMLNGIEVLHDSGIIHRDIKPENFVVGSDGNHHQIYVIDFGLSKYYLDEDGKHIEMKENKGLVGTARYTSVNSHNGFEQSRRDDLESIAYLLVYFARGSLLWQNLQFKDKEERFKKIAELKATTSAEIICKGLPMEFLTFLTLVKKLEFEEKPDYQAYRDLFSKCYAEKYVIPEIQCCYDWCPKNCTSYSRQQAMLRNTSAGLSLHDSYGSLLQAAKEQHLQQQQLNHQQQQHSQQQIPNVPSAYYKSAQRIQGSGIGMQPLHQSQAIISGNVGEVVTGALQTSILIKPPQTQTTGMHLANSTVGIGVGKFNINQSMALNLGQSSAAAPLPNLDSMRLIDSKESDIGGGIHKKEYMKKKEQPLYLMREVDRETQDNDDGGDDNSGDDVPISEFVKGECKQIPLFHTEASYFKHQMAVNGQLFSVPKLQMNSVMLSDTHNHVRVLHTETSQKGGGGGGGGSGTVDQYNHMWNYSQQMFPQQHQQQQQSHQQQGSLSSRYLLPSPRDTHMPAHLFNKESSQYVNQDNSNEWNSSQDEKVLVQEVLHFRSVKRIVKQQQKQNQESSQSKRILR